MIRPAEPAPAPSADVPAPIRSVPTSIVTPCRGSRPQAIRASADREQVDSPDRVTMRAGNPGTGPRVRTHKVL